MVAEQFMGHDALARTPETSWVLALPAARRSGGPRLGCLFAVGAAMQLPAAGIPFDRGYGPVIAVTSQLFLPEWAPRRGGRRRAQRRDAQRENVLGRPAMAFTPLIGRAFGVSMS